jgi:alkanesulfonate monooxygenase SsuD/methylene tetrahydromethanopterin reductase-like flavin-dependent oxidoreductase (luciferase family)
VHSDSADAIEFGWFMAARGVPGADEVPLVVDQERAILPVVAERFDSLWVHDHFYAFEDPAQTWLECWTLLTWLAARYPVVKLGPIVLGVGYRNPALLAKMAASLQALTGGRFIMGIGAGWRAAEYAAFGYPFPPVAERVQQLEEAIQIMRLMWTEPAPTFHGRHFQIEQAYSAPRPLPPPIMIGGGGEKLMLPLIGRQADIWDRWYGGPLESADLPEYEHKLALVRRAATAAGRDPAAIRQSMTIENVRLPESAPESAEWVARLRPLVGLGVRQFILEFGHVRNPDPVRRFAEEVIAPLREGAR